MNKPHKHAELIKAWADGAEIEAREAGSPEWIPVATPVWFIHCDYRIKPEEKKPVVRWLWAWSFEKEWISCSQFFTEHEAKEYFDQRTADDVLKLEYTATEFPE